jgi:tRNA(Ile)-lysidine synthase
MHFLRGAGLAGLKGMEVRTILPVFDAAIPLVRPLLNLWRADTEAYCRAHGLHPHLDPSNTDEHYFRNRLRHSLMPELESYAPGFKVRLLRSAEVLQGDHALLEEMARQARQPAQVSRGEGWLAFQAAALHAMAPALRRLVFRQAAAELRPADRDFGFEALERAAGFIDSASLHQVDFINGLYLCREADKIYLAAYEADLPSAQWPQVTSACPLSSRETNLNNDWVFLTEEQPLNTEHRLLNTDPWSACLDAEKTGKDLVLRPPRPGDRLQPLGMDNGSIKLSDLFVNAKVPRRARAGWPIVEAGGQIAWVPGLRLAQPFRVTGDSRQIVHLQLKKLPA